MRFVEEKERASKALVEAIAAAKILAVEDAIDLTHRLRQETGSYALMAHTGFEHSDFLIVVNSPKAIREY